MWFTSKNRWSAAYAIICASFLIAHANGEGVVPLPIAAVPRTTPVNFTSDILPILQKNCLACHNAQGAENGLSLETPEALRKGGADGPVIVPGKAAESRLMKLAAHVQEPIMPPADNKVGALALTPEQLGLLQLWIDQGAQGEVPTIPRVVTRHALPKALQPILALAITPDGEYVACSRGNRLFVYHLPGMRLAAELSDSSLAAGHAAHEDVIRSLAFARSGDLLASGGFRTVKLWRRPRSRIEREAGGPLPVSSIALSPDGQILTRGTVTGVIELQDMAGNRRLRTFAGHEGAVVGLAMSPDGALLYSAGADKTLRVWDTAAVKQLAKVILSAEVRGLALLHGGNQLATGHIDQVIRLWDTATLLPQAADNSPSPVRELKGHWKPVTCLAAVPASADRLLSGGEDGRLRLWNTASGEPLREFDHGGPVAAVAARPDGRRFASVGANGALRLWNREDGAMIAEAKADPRALQSLTRADGALVYAKACVEYRKQEHREAEEQLKRETGTVEGANKAKEQAEKMVSEKTEAAQKAIAARTAAAEAARPAAEALAAATKARTDAQAAVEVAEKAIAQVTDDFNKARDAAAQDKQNNELAAARDAAEKVLGETKQKKQAADATLQQASLAMREAQQKNEVAARAARQAAEQAKQPERQLEEAKSALQGAINFIATANAVLERVKAAVPAAQTKVADAEVLVTRREMEKKVLADAAQLPLKPLKAVAFSPDSSLLAVAGEGGPVRLFDAEKGSSLEILETSLPNIDVLIFAASGHLFAGGAASPTLMIKPAGPWTLERKIGRADDPDQLVDRVLSLDFSADGKLLATGSGLPSRFGQLKLWNVADGTLAREIPAAHRDTVYGVRFSPDGQYLATAAADRLAKVFRVTDGSLVKTLEGHTHHVLDVAWSADGRLLATSGGDQLVKLWDVEKGIVLRMMRGDAYRIGPYKREVTSVAFIGDTEHLVTSSGDGTVRMHRASSDRDLRAFKEGSGFLHSAIATSDGKLVLGGGRDGVLYVWNGESGYKLSEFKPE